MPCLRTGLIVIVLTPVYALGATEQAKSADSFVDSIGINTHWNNGAFAGNPYGNPITVAKLADLGIRHVRDNSDNATAFNQVDSLYNSYGIKTDLILGSTMPDPAGLVQELKDHPGFEAIEGLNEPDAFPRSYNGFTDNPSTNDYSATRAFQNDLFSAVKADPQTASRTVLSPAMANSTNATYLNGTSFDIAAMHSYPVAHNPTYGLDTNLSQTALISSTPKPVMATETGYYNHPHTGGEVSETAAGKYMPRLFAEYFNRGIQRTYSYELIDEANDPTNVEANFGLLRADDSEKPAFTATKNLIGLLKEPGAPAAQDSLSYTLSGAPSSIHHTLLEKSNGDFYLLLWNEVASWSLANATDISNTPVPVTLTLSHPFASGVVYQPNVSASPLSSSFNIQTLNLNVPDQMMVVQLSSVPEPGAAMLGCVSLLLLRRRRR